MPIFIMMFTDMVEITSKNDKASKNKKKKEESDDIDSFDYDQGYNLNDVYDQ